MAKEWYLFSPPHSSVSGFEVEDFTDPFLETLEEAGIDVELYNYDLSECTQLKAIVQNRVQDTQLQSLNRQFLVPVGTCKPGMYFKYENRYWIIVSNVDNNTIYEKAVATICNWKLEWIDEYGNLVERWAAIESASQYNNGETGMKFYFVRSDQLYVTIPDDDKCINIKDRERFVIDKRCRLYEKSFGDDVKVDTNNLLSTYMLTRSDTILYDYQGEGVVCFIATQDEQHKNDGFYRINGGGHWLCDVPEDNITPELDECTIEYDSDIIYNGIDDGIFTANFGGESVTAHWTIDCDFAEELETYETDTSISISVNNPKLNNKSFELTLTGDGYKPSTITVTIRPFI